MLKSLLRKLRRRPKAVRENVALVAAGIFTFLVFSVWAFTVPSKFSSVPSQSAGIFSTLKNEFAGDAPDLNEIATELKEVIATTSDGLAEESEEIIFEESTIEIDIEESVEDPTARPIRIATTSPATSSPDKQNMLE